MKTKKGVCSKCFKSGQLIRHYILPKRFYGFNKHYIYLCGGCHDKIESIISRLECNNSSELKHSHYYQAIEHFQGR